MSCVQKLSNPEDVNLATLCHKNKSIHLEPQPETKIIIQPKRGFIFPPHLVSATILSYLGKKHMDVDDQDKNSKLPATLHWVEA